MTIDSGCADYRMFQSNLCGQRRKPALTNPLVLVVGVQRSYAPPGRRLAVSRHGAGQEWRKCCRCVLCLVRCGCFEWNGRRVVGFGCGWLAGLMVVIVGPVARLSEILGVLSHRTTRTALTLVLRRRSCVGVFAAPLPAWSLRLPRGRCRSLDIEFVPLHTVFIALSACYGGRRDRCITARPSHARLEPSYA